MVTAFGIIQEDGKNMIRLGFSRVIRGLCLFLEVSAIGLHPDEQ